MRALLFSILVMCGLPAFAAPLDRELVALKKKIEERGNPVREVVVKDWGDKKKALPVGRILVTFQSGATIEFFTPLDLKESLVTNEAWVKVCFERYLHKALFPNFIAPNGRAYTPAQAIDLLQGLVEQNIRDLEAIDRYLNRHSIFYVYEYFVDLLSDALRLKILDLMEGKFKSKDLIHLSHLINNFRYSPRVFDPISNQYFYEKEYKVTKLIRFYEAEVRRCDERILFLNHELLHSDQFHQRVEIFETGLPQDAELGKGLEYYEDLKARSLLILKYFEEYLEISRRFNLALNTSVLQFGHYLNPPAPEPLSHDTYLQILEHNRSALRMLQTLKLYLANSKNVGPHNWQALLGPIFDELRLQPLLQHRGVSLISLQRVIHLLVKDRPSGIDLKYLEATSSLRVEIDVQLKALEFEARSLEAKLKASEKKGHLSEVKAMEELMAKLKFEIRILKGLISELKAVILRGK